MKKSFTLLMVLAMTVAVLLCACTPATPAETSSEVSESSAEESVQEIKGYNNETGLYEYVVSDSDKAKCNGKTIKFLTCGVNQEQESEIMYNELKSDSEGMATVVNEAIAERNNLTEEALGVKITEEYVYDGSRYNGAFFNRIHQDRITGAADYQVVVPCLYDGAYLARNGDLLDLNTIVDTEYPWWSQSMNEECTIDGALYFTLSDIGYVSASTVPAIAFNKEWVDTYHLGDLYQLVRDYQWTLDKLLELVKTYKEDTNNDGSITYEDIFGWAGQLDDMWSLFYGSGEKIATPGADGYPRLTMYNKRSDGVITKMQELVQDRNYYVSANDYFGVAQWPSTLTIAAFCDGRCLFYNGTLGNTSSYANMKDEFGLLPIPLYDEEQESYHSLANPWTSTCFAIPASLRDRESDYSYVGTVLEYMGAMSKNTIEKAFVETVLTYQKVRDDESSEMILKYILPNKGCDVGMIFKWGDLDSLLHSMASNTIGSFASSYDAKSEQAQTQLDSDIEALKDLK